MEYDKYIKEAIESFSPEEKRVFEKIQQKLSNSLMQQVDHKYDWMNEIDEKEDPEPDFSQKHPDILHPKHITIAPHEIVFYIRAEVSEIDDTGHLKGVKDLAEKYYHIPVKVKEDYSLFMDKFFEQFEQTLANTCRDTISK